jgi:hypothetical protein
MIANRPGSTTVQLITIKLHMSTMARLTLLLVLSTFLLPTGQAQNASKSSAQVSFTFDFPGSTPDHYSLSIDSSGQGTYISGKPDGGGNKDADADSDSTSTTDQPWHYEFKVSDAARTRIFDLAKKADYFKGSLDYGKGKIASTGAKTLIYKDGLHSTQATYNYSTKPAVEQLTRLFQSTAATLEFGHRLDYLHHYQKLALDEELKRMEEMARTGTLDELETVAPILKRIADDSTVMNVSRARAERLLVKGTGASPSQ